MMNCFHGHFHGICLSMLGSVACTSEGSTAWAGAMGIVDCLYKSVAAT
jgi:hypothetical protein